MPVNVMLNHNYVMAEGGTGVRALLAAHMYLSSKAYATGGNGTENWKFIYETMDAGAEEIEQLQKLVRLDEESGFCNPHYSFHFCRLAEKVKEKLAGDNTMSLEKIAPEWYRNGLLLTKEELERDLLGGYYRDLTLGSVISAAAMQCALETVEDRNAGFRAIANDVVASNNTYETRVVMVGSGIGGEGRTNLCTHPAMLRKLCVERVMKDLRMEQKQAKAYVEQNLKIAVIMTGSAFRFPAMNGLDQDVAGLVAGTLRNFPEDSAEAVNLFYLLEHDQCPVQATKASDSREQYKHAHAIELVAVAAMEDFFGLGTKHASKKHCFIICCDGINDSFCRRYDLCSFFRPEDQCRIIFILIQRCKIHGRIHAVVHEHFAGYRPLKFLCGRKADRRTDHCVDLSGGNFFGLHAFCFCFRFLPGCFLFCPYLTIAACQ